ncbi:MAG: hypothetical protein LUH09_08865 [Clostridiales bacterium]|nr:hypothetical protein [Clostridiales bacterium]
MAKTCGFITIATGKEEYYKMAANLLHSYRHFSKQPLPFAILADRANSYTEEFDDVIIMQEGKATNSYLDKLELDRYLPYDITVFIDADCLAFGDLNQTFQYFEDADDFSCFGRVLGLDDRTGWFEYENLGELKSRVSYVVGLHGGIYYMRKGETCSRIFETARSLVPDYRSFKFKGKFDTPGDEPLVALSMALNQCKPISFIERAICCYWEHTDSMKIDMVSGVAQVCMGGKAEHGYETDLVHWGTRFTRDAEYQKQVALLNILEDSTGEKEKRIQVCRRKYSRMAAKKRITNLCMRVKNKLLRTIGVGK